MGAALRRIPSLFLASFQPACYRYLPSPARKPAGCRSDGRINSKALSALPGRRGGDKGEKAAVHSHCHTLPHVCRRCSAHEAAHNRQILHRLRVRPLHNRCRKEVSRLLDTRREAGSSSSFADPLTLLNGSNFSLFLTIPVFPFSFFSIRISSAVGSSPPALDLLT